MKESLSDMRDYDESDIMLYLKKDEAEVDDRVVG